MKKLLALTILLSLSLGSFAQILVKGTVKDSNGEAVPGAAVIISGSSVGTVTDIDGSYQIQAKDAGSVLEVSCIGYESVTEKVGKRTVIDFSLEASTSFIEETVVVGYGTMRKKDLTGSVGSIKSEVLENKVLLSVDDALAGGVAGLMVSSASGKPGSSSTMLVRGANSLTGSTAPLIVVDGFPLFDVSTSSGGGIDAFDTGMSSLSMINTDDIASIEVLKDASATAIYGNRGANGVILITTKKGKEAGGKIQYSNYFGLQTMGRRYDMMNVDEFAAYQAERNSGNGLFYDTVTGGARNVAGMQSHDWQDEIFRHGFIQNHSLSVSHATKKTNFMFSGSFLQDKSILICTDWKKLTAKATIDHYFTDHVRMGIDISYSRIMDDGVPTGGNGAGGDRQSGVITAALMAPPYDMNDTDTQTIFRRAGVTQNSLDTYVANYHGNPVTQAQDTQMSKKINRTIVNSYFEADLYQDLVLRVTAGADIYSLKDRQYYPISTGRGWFYKGQGILGNSESTSWVNENTLTWRPTFGKHRLNVLAGVSEQQYVGYWDMSETTQYEYEGLGYNNAQMGLVHNINSSKSTVTYLSFMARANYSYDNRYIATFTYRRDGTSRFVKNKWGNFFSGALAWNIDQEAFMKEQSTVSTLKLRLSAGQVGNSNVPTTGSYAQLANNIYSFGGNEKVGQSAASIANEGLTWETTTEFNVGLEAGFLNDRITFNADAYYKITDGLLLEAPVVNVAGFEKAWQNIGKMCNKGVELSLNAAIINKKDFKWNFNANFSFNKTQILELGQNGAPIYLGINCLNGLNAIILQEGGAVGDFYGYKTIGVYGMNDFMPDGVTPKPGVALQSGAERPGYMKVADLVPDGKITDSDRMVIGNSLPDMYGAFGTDITWKNLNLNIGFQYSIGAQVYNANYNFIAIYNSNSYNQCAFFRDRWSNSNMESTMYSSVIKDEVCSAYVEDASFLRLKTLRLSYTLPRKWFSPKTHIDTIRAYVAADNLYVFTKYSGYDPEVSSVQNGDAAASVLTSGFDYGCFPRPKTFTLGFNFTFK